jgi:tetrahydromethanopterin S-methyltransferase subunit F
MANKRTLPAITTSDSFAEPSWMSDYAKRLSKEAVQPYRKDHSVYDQIYSIINSNRPQYPSVDAAVKDMQERSGLLAYQDKLKTSSGQDKIKTIASQICRKAEEHKEKEVKVFKLHPPIKNTIDNWIEAVHGNLPVPAVITRAKEIHRNDISDDQAWDDDGLLAYVNDKCQEVQERYPTANDSTNLGRLPHFSEEDIDPSNRDALHCLNPVAIK